METTTQVRKRGVLTLPSDLRDKYTIQEGDTFRLVDLDGIFVLTEARLELPGAVYHVTTLGNAGQDCCARSRLLVEQIGFLS